MEVRLKNSQIRDRCNQMGPVLAQRNKIGYVAARNYRILSEALTEYNAFRNQLFEKYAEDDVAENGETIKTIKAGTPSFKSFCDELTPINEVEQTLNILTLKYEEVIGSLSGEEILAVDWMLED